MSDFIDKIKFKNSDCSLNQQPPQIINERYVNLYVKIADTCNANCPFCVYHNKFPNFIFDFKKFKYIINTLLRNDIEIHKISFTGGEPTTNRSGLHDVIKFLGHLPIKPFIVVNTNGFRLDWLTTLDGIDSIALSRHAVSDNDQYQIMNTKTCPTASNIQFHASDKIHLTCNLINGYIDSVYKVEEYLEFCQSIGIYDVGFVSLMKVNHYCEQHHLDFDDIKIETSGRVACNREWNCTDICKCKNYLYLPTKGTRLVKFYSRYRCKDNVDMGSTLVYDGTSLRTNFSSDVLI